MRMYKRVQLRKNELLQLRQDCEDYIWAAVDPRKYIISVGDDYLADLRDDLLLHNCHPEDIFGIGMDLETGEVDFVAQINRRNPTVDGSGELSIESQDNIRETLHYFFEKLPAYRKANNNKTDEDLKDFSGTTIAFR